MTREVHIIRKDYYWYDDIVSWKVIFGVRGGPEYRIDMHRFNKIYTQLQVQLRRQLTPEEVFKLCVKESQYVDFEEVKPETKLLS